MSSKGCGKSQNWEIRRMRPEDVGAVAALESVTFSEPWSEKGFLDAIAQSDNIFLVAVTAAGRIAAYCGLYTASDEGEITNVAVAQSLRGQGLGCAIVSELLGLAFDSGISQIFLEVRKSNETARKLYEKAGFTICGIRKGFYRKPDEDAYVMCAKSSKLH